MLPSQPHNPTIAHIFKVKSAEEEELLLCSEIHENSGIVLGFPAICFAVWLPPARPLHSEVRRTVRALFLSSFATTNFYFRPSVREVVALLRGIN
jgi:hypothetical protein